MREPPDRADFDPPPDAFDVLARPRDEAAFDPLPDAFDVLARPRVDAAFEGLDPAFDRPEVFDRLDADFDAPPRLAALARLDDPLEPALAAERDELPEPRPPERRERPPPFRCEAGISVFTTSLVSWGMVFSRKLAMRSSSLRNWRASFAVSLSPTASASVSIAL